MLGQAVAVAAAGGGVDVLNIYQLATAGLSVEEEKKVQRRFKEAILKTCSGKFNYIGSLDG